MLKKKRKKVVKLPPEELKKRKTDRQFKVRINTAFKNSGFEQISTKDKNITLKRA